MKQFWNRISKLGCTADMEFDEARRIRLLNRINFITALVLVLYLVIELSIGITVFVPGLLLMLALSALTFLFTFKRKLRLAKNFAVIVISWCISYFVLATGDAAAEAMFIPLCIMPLIIFKNKRPSAFYLFYLSVLFVFLKFSQQHITPLLVLTPTLLFLFRIINILTSLVVTYTITYYFKGENEQYEAKLENMHQLVSEQNKEITDSIKYAKHIQNAILPPIELLNNYLSSSFVFYRPKAIVAGDFYWIYEEEKQDKVYIAAADCTGHGVPGAMVSLVCYTALNRAVGEFGNTQPAGILDKTRELVVETFEHQQMGSSTTSLQDGMDISLICLDKKNNCIEWAGANNPLWIHRKDAGVLEEFKADKQAVGKVTQARPFSNHRIDIKKGDRIYLFTDGFADQFGGPNGKKFKYARLKESLLQLGQDPELELGELLQNWQGHLEQVDDILVLGICY